MKSTFFFLFYWLKDDRQTGEEEETGDSYPYYISALYNLHMCSDSALLLCSISPFKLVHKFLLVTPVCDISTWCVNLLQIRLI